MFSIIIPTSNSSEYIHYALESIIKQSTNDEIEVIIIDDNSNDIVELNRVIESYSKKLNIKFFVNDYKTNGAVCRNIGLENASGDYICFLDADDYWSSNKLEKGKWYLENNKFKSVVYTRLKRGTREQVQSDDCTLIPLNEKNENTKLSDYWFIEKGVTQTSSIMYKKDDFIHIRFNESLQRHQDYDLCLKLEDFGAKFVLDKDSITYWIILKPSLNAVSKGACLDFCIQWLNDYQKYLSKNAISSYIAKNMFLISFKEKNLIGWINFIFKQNYASSFKIIYKTVTLLLERLK